MSFSCLAILREVAKEISAKMTNMETNKGYILSSLASNLSCFLIMDELKFSVLSIFSESMR